jgi:ABC-type nitrate/sulfonate/bicarbonate transport system substrate-binding protein
MVSATMLLVALVAAACGGAGATTGPAPARTQGAQAGSGSGSASHAGGGGSGAAAGGAPLTPITVAYTAPTGAQAPLFFMQDFGLARRHGLNMHLVYLPSTTAMQALVGGSIDVAANGGGELLSADLGGAKVRLIGAMQDQIVMSLMSQPSLTAGSQLDGKAIAVSKAGSTTYFAALAALKHLGIPTSRVRFVYAGSVPAILAALKADRVAAGIVSPPTTFRAEKLGLRQLVDVTALDIPFAANGLDVTASYLAAHRATLQAFVAACAGATAYAGAHPAQAAASLQKHLKLSAALARETYQAFIHVWPVGCAPSAAALQAVIQADPNPRAKTLSASSLIVQVGSAA